MAQLPQWHVARRTCDSLVPQVGEMLKDREGVLYGGMAGKGLKVRPMGDVIVVPMYDLSSASFVALWLSSGATCSESVDIFLKY